LVIIDALDAANATIAALTEAGEALERGLINNDACCDEWAELGNAHAPDCPVLGWREVRG
jgi:hypothetical protein